jgi:hypothetical protein
LFNAGDRVLTHCNAGALATAGYGTAIGVITSGFRDGKIAQVWVDETRPLLQGARLTTWELERQGIPFRLVTDNSIGALVSRGLVDRVVVGADRIAANGDTANKIGTYTVAVLAHRHGVPFYVAAPLSTIDRAGGEIAARGERHGFDPEQIEKGRAVYDTSPLAVVVVAAPVYSDKIPKVEQIHSAGAVCLSLVNAALAAGWGAGWVTGWVAHDRRFLPTALGLTSAESIAGIVHIGTPPGKPPERPRPDIAAITTWAGG